MASWMFRPFLIAVVISAVSSQCPAPRKINKGVGDFASANLAKDNLKINCTWRFSSNSFTKYAFKLEVKKLRFYNVIRNGTKCVPRFYNLSINGDLFECDKSASEAISNTFCHAYYNDDTCESLSDITGCELSQKTKFPVDVKYDADGRDIVTDSRPELWMYGFRISYQFIQCPDKRYIIDLDDVGLLFEFIRNPFN